MRSKNSRRPSRSSRLSQQLDNLEPRLLLTAIAFTAGKELPVNAAGGAFFADLNGDGAVDFIGNDSATLGSQQIQVALATGDAGFNPVGSYGGLTGGFRTAADFNGDGKIDVVTSNGSNLNVYLNNGNGTFALPQILAAGALPSLTAVGDLNHDGKLDFIVFNSGSNTFSCFINNGSGFFGTTVTFPAFSATTNTLVIGDFDADGNGDIVTTGFAAKGNGNGSFQNPVIVNIPANAVAQLADFNHDGRDDLVAASTSSTDINVFTGTATGALLVFQKTYTNAGPNIGLAVADFNGDSFDDFATSDSSTITVYMNSPNKPGTFSPAKSFLHSALANDVGLIAADVNNDGDVDLVSFDPGSNYLNLILNKGDGTFFVPVPYNTPSNANIMVSGDFNGDHRADLVTIEAYDTVAVRMAGLDGTLGAPVTFQPDSEILSVAVGDLNGDGRDDFVTTSWLDDSFSVFLSNGNGTFAGPFVYDGPYDARVVRIVDLNHDGRKDLVVAGDYDLNVYMNFGGSLFGDPIADYSTNYNYIGAMAIGDFNGDSQFDIAYLNNDTGSINFYFGNGAGFFPIQSSISINDTPTQLIAGDFNKDNRTDLAALAGNQVYLLLANANGTMSVRSISNVGTAVADITAADFNGDGFLDIAAISTDSNGNVGVLRGNGDGTFRDFTRWVAGSQASAITSGDVNADNKLDIITDANVLLNVSGPTPTSVHLTSSVPNSNYGDSVTLTAKIAANGLVATGNVQFSANGVNLGAPVPLVNGTATLTTSAVNAGAATIRATFGANADFSSSTTTLVLNVAKVNLSVSVNPATRQYGLANPAFTGTFSGLVNNDPITLNFKTTATVASHPGDYPITPAFADPKNKLKNYNVVLTPGDLTITKANQVISWPAPVDIFGGNPLTTKQLSAKVLHPAGTAPGGALTYDTPLNTVLPIGTHTLTVTANATADYNQASASVDLHVNPPGPNLQVAIGALTPAYTNFVPGETIKIPVTLTNIGNQTAPATVALPISLFLRTGATNVYDPANPLLAPVMLVTAPMKANAKKSFTISYKIPLNFDPATFFITSAVDSPDAASDPNPDNNTAASPSVNVSNSFGVLPGRKPAAILTYVDPDGTLVKFTLTGGGTGALAINGNDVDLTITGASAKSSLTILATKSKTPGDDGLFTLHDLNINSAFANIAALATTLTGDLTINGAAGALSFLNIDGGVATSALTVTGALKSLTSKNNLANTTLAALSVGTLAVTSNITHTSIHLSQTVDPKLKALTTLTAKQFVNSEIRSAGNLGNITLTLIASSRIFAGVLDSVTALPISAADFVDFDATLLPTLANFTLKVAANVATPTFTDSYIAAGRLLVVKLPTLATTLANPLATPFGFASRLAPSAYTGIATTGNFLSSKDNIL